MQAPLALLEEMHKTLNAIGAGGQPTLKVEQQSTPWWHHLLHPDAGRQPVRAVHRRARLLPRLPEAAAQHRVYFLREREARLATLRTLSDIDEHMTTYFGTFTIVNVCLGIVTVALTWFIGLPNPLLWGVLAGVLNYVPYIGPAVVVGTLAVVGLADLPDAGRGGRGAADLSRHRRHRGPVPDAGPDGPAAGAQSLCRVPRHRLLHLAVGPDRGVPGRAAADGPDRDAGPRVADEKPDLPD